MSIKGYINDKYVIFFNLILILMGVFNVLLVILRIDTTQSVAFISANTTLSRPGFEPGSTVQLYRFAIIPIVIVAMQTLLAWRMHSIKRGISMLALSLGMVLMVFSIVVSSAILNLHR